MIPETSIMQHATRPANLDLETAIPRTRPLMTSTDLSLTIDAYNPDLTRRVTDGGDMADYVSGGVADIQHKICRTTAVTNSDTESGELIREPRLVIGVKFIADLARWSQDHQHGVTILGSILLDKQDEQMPGDEVRRALLCQLPEAPVRFLFLSHDGPRPYA
ncbi:uncharacterized protein LOC111272242 isoform X2 [Varroa jacobsoni]|uniref:uncharacterized protein LOC111272242 isoform X2 n=1 Tax=Varroa jacobsoni TaxID=62625 RepID=UPI000BF3EB23|nr:uncharacterized protein LOC111272242 isoform X2 [Varroa jacobsoni]